MVLEIGDSWRGRLATVVHHFGLRDFFERIGLDFAGKFDERVRIRVSVPDQFETFQAQSLGRIGPNIRKYQIE